MSLWVPLKSHSRNGAKSMVSTRNNDSLNIVLPALVHLPRRAERRSGDAIRRTFVDLGPLSTSLSSEEHQIVYGRRGTGKTHALENLVQQVRSSKATAISIDLRTIGSAGSYYLAGPDSIASSATHVIVDLLEETHHQLVDRSLELIEDGVDVTTLVRHLDALAVASADIEVVGNTETSEESAAARHDSRGLEAAFSGAASLALTVARTDERSRKYRRSQAGLERYSLKFGPIARSLAGAVACLPHHTLWIVLDEWSALPLGVQPLVADFLRRCWLPVAGLVVKIAAIQARSQFNLYGGGHYLGLELGADIMQDLDLDEYLAWNERNRRADEFFQQLFSQHISEYWRARGKNLQPEEARRRLWSAIPPSDFPYLVMAGGGVPRDAINVASIAVGESGYNKVDWLHISSATRKWFLNDKEGHIRSDHASRRVLQNLRMYAKTQHRRGFMLERHHDGQAPEIQDLYDARIVHRIARGVGPEAKYDAFLLDFGVYADMASESDRMKGWRENWLSKWSDFDPVKAPEVRQSVLSIEDLRSAKR